jgi:predicted MFS family arabinose efflux permease
VLAPLAGAAVDRIGARRGLVAAIVVWSAVSAVHALVPSFAVLFALRIALGAAESPSFPAAAQSVKRALPQGDRSTALGLIFTGSSIGAAIAGPLAISLDVAYGWRTAFAIASLVGLAWLPAWLLVTRSPGARAALARPTETALVAGPAPSPQRPLFTDPAVLRAMFLVLACAPGLMFLWVWLPQYLELGRGMAKASLPHYVWLPPLMADAGMVGFGALASRMDRRASGGHAASYWPLVLVAALLETTLVLVPSVPGSWPAIALIGLSAAGGGGLYTLLTADMMARVDPSRVAMAGGFTAAAQSLAHVVLNPIVGHSIDASHSYDGAMIGLGSLALPGALVWIVWSLRSGRARVTGRAL